MSVQIRNLCKTFGSKKVLNNLNITLEDGGIYCLMGPSGMGKTTLLRIIMNLESKDAGEITGIDPDVEISSMFQEDRILPMLSAVANVNMMYEKKRPVKEIKEDLSQILPKKCLRQPVCELSGGMKRRVSLARCMHYQGKMIILDEPFTGLDMATKQEVISYILKNRRNRILLVATHGIEDAALLGAEVIHLENCQELTDEMQAAIPSAQEMEEKLGGEPDGLISSSLKQMLMGAGEMSVGAYMMRHMAETNLKLLDGILESEWENMGSILDGRIQEFEAGKLIWNIGDTCTEFAVVLSGMVAAYTESLKQVESLVAKFGQGRCFGEMLPLSGACSPVKVVAAEDSRILFLSREKLIKYLNSLPTEKDGSKIMFSMQKETAQYLHVSPEALSKELNDMERKGLIRKEENKVQILQPELFALRPDSGIRSIHK
ncbi:MULTISPECIES: ATP-binding cassette domain-containing protein [Blautia]|uniref:ABC-type nitrate/sulfonate/bicarbonate transport system, ATPase component n=1 Tax=Blautia obeum A2-162 TaxID=657314 RepID=D4LT73_9FIRM|nr:MULTISPECIES: ATP-binding cassette domain-containing protein [Blautia]CBL23981.1 ABC-type nitrate/sulfonate/bicarbonate transport system, ATPase component [Blautia obeum A2-162]